MHSVSNSHRWRRALSHQLQRRAAGCSRQRLRSVPSTVTQGRGSAAPPPTASAEGARGRAGRCNGAGIAPCWPPLTDQPDRPTRVSARAALGIRLTQVPARVSGARIRRQGAERAGPACFRRACSTPVRARRVGLRIAWPWRPSAVTVVTVVSVRPSRVRLAPSCLLRRDHVPVCGGVSFVALTVSFVCL